MAEYIAGQSPIYIEWLYSGGTVLLHSDFRRFQIPETVGLVEATAGVDTDESFIPSFKRGQASMEFVLQTGGTVLRNALDVGTSGTLRYGPEGTATGKPKKTAPFIVENHEEGYPYEQLAVLTVQFRKTGAMVNSSY